MNSQYSKKKTFLAVGGIITLGLIIIGLFVHFNSWSIVPAEVNANLELATERYNSVASYADEELAANGFTDEFYERATYVAEIAEEQFDATRAYDEVIAENKSRNIFETNSAWFFLAGFITLAATIIISFRL